MPRTLNLMSRPANNECWNVKNVVKFFNAKVCRCIGIQESLIALFSLSITSFSLPKFILVVAESFFFFPRIVWSNSLLFSFEKRNWSVEHSVQNHWVLSFLNKSYRPGRNWGWVHLLREKFSLSLEARCITVVWTKRWWVAWGGQMADMELHPGCPKSLKKIFNLKFAIM